LQHASNLILGPLDTVDDAVDVVMHERRYSSPCISSAI
jgi:hypothetical protein